MSPSLVRYFFYMIKLILIFLPLYSLLVLKISLFSTFWCFFSFCEEEALTKMLEICPLNPQIVLLCLVILVLLQKVLFHLMVITFLLSWILVVFSVVFLSSLLIYFYSFSKTFSQSCEDIK